MPLPYRNQGDVNRDALYVEGRFRPNGASAIDNTLNQGISFTATRTGVGTATIKINVPARKLLNIQVDLYLPALAARRIEKRNAPVQGTDGMWTQTIVLTDLNNAGPTAQEFAATGADYWIGFSAQLQLVGG